MFHSPRELTYVYICIYHFEDNEKSFFSCANKLCYECPSCMIHIGKALRNNFVNTVQLWDASLKLEPRTSGKETVVQIGWNIGWSPEQFRLVSENVTPCNFLESCAGS
jgi:hypothetical protein